MSIKVNCVVCGKETLVSPSRFNENGNCCSFECLGEKNRAEPNVKCYMCGKKFHVKKSYLKRTNNPERICCSKECSKKERSERFMGENNHQYGLLGDLNSSYKSDFTISNYGYILVRSPNHPFRNGDNQIFYHRLVFEEFCKETNQLDYLVEINGSLYLSKDFIIHHKNENKLDNTICNLEAMYLGEHTSHHNTLNPVERDLYTGRLKKGLQKGKKMFRKHTLDAGNDLFSDENITIESGKSVLIKTGTFIKLPETHIGLIWSRSGLSVKHKIEVGAGCIDENFRGEIKVHLYNLSNEDFAVKKGDRIAQLLVIPVNLTEFEVVEDLPRSDRQENGFGSTEQLSETERGEGGHGHTGT